MEKQDNNSEEKKINEKSSLSDNTKKAPKDVSRRNVLKAFAGVPVAGLLGFELLRKIDYDKSKRQRIIQELGLDKMEFSIPDYGREQKQDIIRIGIIGFRTACRAIIGRLGIYAS